MNKEKDYKLRDVERIRSGIAINVAQSKHLDSINTYAVGDIVRDEHGIMLIQERGYVYGYNPVNRYAGIELDGDLNPIPNMSKRYTYQPNIIEKIR